MIDKVIDIEAARGLLQAPESLGALGVPEGLVIDLFVKHLLQAGTGTLRGLSHSLRIPVQLVETLFHQLKLQRLIEVKGMYGEDFSFSLSNAGKEMASDRMKITRYGGPVPVPLSSYEAVVRAQVAKTKVNRARMREAYKDLTLDAGLLNRLGPALVSQKSMFLFGPSGTGKSALAERLLRIFNEAVAVPYAVEVDGTIITLFDTGIHHPVEGAPPDRDLRWEWCARPCIIVGGELVPSMLELQRDDATGSYVAPMHMKANNGVFVIDDFGRQMISPRDLLNRWIVPLDRRVDFLSISSGVKFAIPFEVFVVFSTNLQPTELADEAFLRRIPNKILVDAVAPPVFDEIVERRLAGNGWQVEPQAIEHLRRLCVAKGGDLRPCYPRDFIAIMESIALFEEREPAFTAGDIDRAGALYFAVV
jgi:hypothetical protein